MSGQKLLLYSASTLLVLSLNTRPTLSQRNQSDPANERARKIKSEPRRIYQDWPKRDVALIITPECLPADLQRSD